MLLLKLLKTYFIFYKKKKKTFDNILGLKTI